MRYGIRIQNGSGRKWACAVLSIVFLLCVLAPITVRAEEDSETIRVGYYENEVFQEGASENSVKTGYAYEYYHKISEYTGWQYEYVYGDYNELYQMLIDGEIDLLAGLAYKEERASLMSYPDAPMGCEAYNLIKHDEDVDITASPSSMNGKKIGVLDSAMVDVLQTYLKSNRVKAKIITFRDYESLLNAFDSHEIDILATEGDGTYGREYAEVLGAFGTTDYYLCVNIHRQDLLNKLNEAQTQLAVEEPNYIVSLRTRYYPVTMSSMAYSEAEKTWMSEHTSLRVGYLNHYFPYSDTDNEGNVTGMVQDIVPKMLENLKLEKLEVQYSGYDSYDEMIKDMNSGAIDLAFPVGGGLYYSEENGVYQSNPVVSSVTELVYKGEYDETSIVCVAVNENNRIQDYYVRTNYPDVYIRYYSSIEECLKAVMKGEADATILNGLRANDIMRNSKYSELALRQLNWNDDSCFGVRIGNDGLLKLVNRGITMYNEDYVLNQAYHYTDQLYKHTLRDALRDNMTFFATIILGIGALLIAFLVHDSQYSKKQMVTLEQVSEELSEKNDELDKSRQELTEALTAVENTNKAKNIFLNNMSQDIQTPMNAIAEYTTLALASLDNKQKVREYLGKISASSQHLLSLISDVMDMSRIENGKVKIDEADVYLPDLIRDIRNIVQPNVAAKRQELIINTQDIVNENVITDKLRLNQILLNILSNSVKFTQPEGIISLCVIENESTSSEYADFEFRIKDNGIGMSEEFQKMIFDAFTREHNVAVSSMQGTGMGMAITKNIVDMMNGTITVNSTEGAGSEFVINLSFRISDNKKVYAPIPKLKGLCVLVAEDESQTCQYVCSVLEDIGIVPNWTNYGKDAVARAKEAYDNKEPYDAYIIEWLMPDLSGIEIVRKIRKIIGDITPIIILTAYDWSDIEEEANAAGVTAFCSKPVFMSELRETLSTYCMPETE